MPMASHENESTTMTAAASLIQENKLKAAQLHSMNQQINILEQEVELLKLEKKWCFDAEGKRKIPTAEQQALKICQELVLYPHLTEDVVKALRMKHIDLQTNLSELQLKCDALKEYMK
ncbi:unnamed protein product [Lymnaea stagnalis]|uniref:Uncharacterized protein n=1 Tax=Lymnaea stagnalis TaxID=6523 RepID=A0AAV2HPZ8_LYMST